MIDKGINSENVAEQLISKGRTEEEAKERAPRQQWAIYKKFQEEELCDYIITNSHDPKTDKWEMGKADLLDRFGTILGEFQSREQQIEECLRMILPEGMNLESLRIDIEKEKWNFEPPAGFSWIYDQMNRPGLDSQTVQNLYREFRLQRRIDLLLMRPIEARIREAIISSRETIPENDMHIRQDLEKQYKDRWQTLDEDENGLFQTCYKGLINIVPLFPGESVRDRIKLLRSPYRDQDGPLFKADKETLQRKLLQISSPRDCR